MSYGSSFNRRRGSRRFAKSAILFIGCLAAAGLLAACGGDSNNSTSESPTTGGTQSESASDGAASEGGKEEGGNEAGGDLKKVSIRLDWFPVAQHAGYYTAKAKGFFEEEGLDVDLVPGQGSPQVVQQVSTGHDQFGNAYGIGVVFGDAAGANVKAVANYAEGGENCIEVLADSGITEPKQLEGKVLGIGTGSPFAAVLPIVWANSGTDGSNVTVQEVNPAAGLPSLAQGRVDGWLGQAWQGPIEIEDDFHKKANCISYADYGANLMGPSLITSEEMIEKEPETVQKFVNASLKGWLYSFEHPEEAAEAFVEETEGMEGVPTAEQVAKAQPVLVESISSENNIGEPYGSMNEKDWTSTEKIMREYLELEGNTQPSEFFTNEFVPPSSPRVNKEGIPG